MYDQNEYGILLIGLGVALAAAVVFALVKVLRDK